MKRSSYYVLTLGLVCAFVGSTFAQQTLKMDDHSHPVKYSEAKGPYGGTLGKKANVNEWFSPRQLMSDYGATFSGPGFFPLFQDSSVFYVPSATAQNQNPFSNGFNLYGTVFQPSDELYSLQTSDGASFDRFDRPICDSIYFPYSYIRQVDQIDVSGEMIDVVDTIYVHYYENKNLTTTWQFNNSEETFSMPITGNFSVKRLGPSDVTHIDTVLLMKAAATDSTLEESINLGGIALAVPSTVNKILSNSALNDANVIGFSIVYKTMVPYSFGDTILSYNDNVVPSKKLNAFGTASYTNSGARVIQTDYNNNSFATNRQVRYGQKDLDPLVGYLPTLQSVGWGSDFYFDGAFHLVGDNSVGDVQNELGVKVYPNPASKGTNLVVKANNVKGGTVSIALIDLVGNTVYNSGSMNYQAAYNVSTSALLPGIYFVSVSANGISSTQKVVITE
ncbi:MAG: hypothetical protein ACI8ZN_000477 [Bacteroidia bacterium]|jgi:hypothetical protein